MFHFYFGFHFHVLVNNASLNYGPVTLFIVTNPALTLISYDFKFFHTQHTTI